MSLFRFPVGYPIQIKLTFFFFFAFFSQSTLGHVHPPFPLALESLAAFWKVLDEIDEKTWVLEPEKHCRADTMRRIAIGSTQTSATILHTHTHTHTKILKTQM